MNEVECCKGACLWVVERIDSSTPTLDRLRVLLSLRALLIDSGIGWEDARETGRVSLQSRRERTTLALSRDQARELRELIRDTLDGRAKDAPQFRWPTPKAAEVLELYDALEKVV